MAANWNKVEKNIFQNEENPRKFRVELYFGRDERGKMKKSRKVIEGTLKDARNYLKIHEANMLKGTVQKPSKATLQLLFDNWNTYVGDVQNAETTQTSTRNIQRHMLEYFGDIRVDKISTSLIRKYLAYLKSDKGLSSRTVNKHRAHLHTLYNYMLTEEDIYGIYKNQVDGIRPYPEEEYNYEIYSPDEAKDLLIALRLSGRHDLEIAVNLAFWCACRREEVCALDWKNVHLDVREIKICEVRTTAKGKVIERSSTKNKEIRMVGIPDWFYDCLMLLKAHQDEMRKAFGDTYYKGKDYVFCHNDGTPWHPNSLSREYKTFLEANNFKIIRFHDLRHTNLSMLMTKLSAVEVAKLGGHKQVSTTVDIYGHAFDGTIDHGIDTMNDIMGSVMSGDNEQSE